MEPITTQKKRNNRIIIGASILLICLMIVSLFLGRLPFTFQELLQGVLAPFEKGQVQKIMYQLRFPRILGAVLIGGSLAMTGVAYQSVFQNPIASPGSLGAQAGASFGAALALFFMWGSLAVTGSAFIMGIISVFLVYVMSQKLRGNKMLTLILSGSMVSSLFSSATSYLKLIADPNNTLPAITYWLMGSLSSLRMRDIAMLVIPVVGGAIIFMLYRWQLNILTMGEEEAKSLGVSVASTRKIMLATATLVTAACVAVSGVIGWVGLVVPHFARRIVGSDHRYLVPASIIFGSIFLLIVDNVARLVAGIEVPLGILTSFIGAPFFFYLMLKGEKKI